MALSSAPEETTLETIEPSHYEELAAYLARSWQQDRALFTDRLPLWWENNPNFAEEIPRGYLLRAASGQIVGFLGGVSLLIQANFKPLVVVASTAWIIDKPYRVGGGSLNLLLAQIGATERTCLITDTAANATSKILTRLRFKKVSGSGAQSYFLGNAYPALKSRLAAKKLPSLVLQLLAKALETVQYWRIKERRCPGLEVRELFHCGSEFDELWSETSRQWPTTFVRSSQQLNWFCFSSQACLKKVFGAYSHGRLVAFMILGPRNSDGYQVYECYDYWQAESHDQAAYALLAFVGRYARRKKIVTLLFSHFSEPLTRALLDMKFFRRSTEPGHTYYLQGDECQDDPFASPFYLSKITGDRGL